MTEAVLSLPQDMKLMLRIAEDPDIDDEGRVQCSGALLHVLSASNSIPGVVGTLAFVDDALILRLVVENIEKTNPKVIERHRDDSPEFFGPMEEQMKVTRDYLGDLMQVLDAAAAGVNKLNHVGHTAQQCGTDDDEATWLYDAVQEALVEQLEFDEDDVARELKHIDQIVPHLRTRVG
ncbi:MAG: hypothetical protein AAGF12_25935 [Myxococcota bacterium]